MKKKVRGRFHLIFTEAAARSKAETSSLGPGLSWSLSMKKPPSKKGDSKETKAVPDQGSPSSPFSRDFSGSDQLLGLLKREAFVWVSFPNNAICGVLI